MGLASSTTTEEFPFIERTSLRRVAILCHRHADPDAYLSAFAIRSLLGAIAPGSVADIILPEGMSTLTQRLADTFPYEKHDDEGGSDGDEEDYDLLVAVDTGHSELLAGWEAKLKQSRGFKVLIDHHPISNDSLYDRMVVDTSSSSAGEVVYSIFKRLKVEPDAKTAQALLLAILFDSQHLAIAGENALRAVIALLDRGARLDTGRAMLRSPPDYGEVVAKLKAARRSRAYRAAGWVIVASTVGSFQANVARAFVSMGADVGIAVGETDGGETRGSLRSSARFRDGTGIHLGTDVAEAISRDTGYGGGHATAASFTCKLGEEEVIERTLKLIGEQLLHETPIEIK